MPIALTCDCGARFEVDESFAGRDIPCPDCSIPVHTPARANTSPRPSWAALAAAALLLPGAFTVVGSAAAALLAFFALYSIRRQKDAVGGTRLALGTAVAGVALTALTVLLWASPSWLPVGRWIRSQALAGQVDPAGPMELPSSDGVCSLTRPSKDWARATRGRVGDPAVGDLQKDRLLVLAYLPEKAYADLGRIDGQGNRPWEELYTTLSDELIPDREQQVEEFRPFGRGRDNRSRPTTELGPQRGLGVLDGKRGQEWTVDLKRGGLRWRFLIRAFKKPNAGQNDPVHVARAYASASSFARLEPELSKILDSLKFGR